MLPNLLVNHKSTGLHKLGQVYSNNHMWGHPSTIPKECSALTGVNDEKVIIFQVYYASYRMEELPKLLTK